MKHVLVSATLLFVLATPSVLAHSSREAEIISKLKVKQAQPRVVVFSLINGLAMAHLGQALQKSIKETTEQDQEQQLFTYKPDEKMSTSRLSGVFIGFESRVRPSLAFQYGIEYSQATAFLVSGTLNEAFSNGEEPEKTYQQAYKYHYKVQSQRLLFEGKLIGTATQNTHLYLLFGMGSGINTSSDYQQTVNYQQTSDTAPTIHKIDSTTAYGDSRNTTVVYVAGAGIEYDLAAHWRIGLGYRFINLGQTALGKSRWPDLDPDSSSPPNPYLEPGLTITKFYSHEFSAQLSYLF